jgi:hypothetical protein
LVADQTVEYLESLLRDGDDVKYFVWLRRVRQQEARAQSEKTKLSSGSDAAVDESSISTPPSSASSPKSIEKVVQPLPELHRKTASLARTSELQEGLLGVYDAWLDYEDDRSRDAVFGYLKAVYSIVLRYKRRGKTKKLLRRAFKFVNLPFDRDADLFATVIRSTCERSLDPKTISKWSRALRYAAFRNRAPRQLKAFMKALGGINSCADRYAKISGRGRG